MQKIRHILLLVLTICTSMTFHTAGAQMITNGVAANLGNGCYRLTQDGASNTVGSIWSTNRINVNNPFDLRFKVYLNNSISFPADGMAFVLQNDPDTTAVLGLAGRYLGYLEDTSTNTGAILPSIGFEIDYWGQAGVGFTDPVAGFQHLSIQANSNPYTAVAGPTGALPGNGDVTTGNCWDFRVTWDPVTDQLNYYFNGALRLSVTYDIVANVFPTNQIVYWGFTGATGSEAVEQVVCMPFANAGADTSVCMGDTIQLTASGGTSYVWSAPSFPPPAVPPGLSCSNCQTTNFTAPFVFSPFTYFVNVTNSFGCVDRDTVQVVVEPSPTANAGGDQTICFGDTVQIGAASTPGYLYSWTPADSLSDPSVSDPMAFPANTTTYYVTATDTTTINQCAATDSMVVTVNPLPVADAGLDQTICDGDSAQIGTPVVGGMNYSWTPVAGLSNPNVASPMASPAGTTTYVLTITNASTGCQDTDTVTVNWNPLPLATVLTPDTSICAGDAFTLRGDSVLGNQVSWTPATGLSSVNTLSTIASPTATTTYYLTVSDIGTGCGTTDSVLITVNPLPPANAGGDTLICLGDTALIGTAGAPGFSYAWNPVDSLGNPAASQTQAWPGVQTAYELTVTDLATGCFSSDTVIVDVFRVIPSGSGDTTICLGDTIPLTVSGGDVYLWTSTGWMSNPDSSTTFVAPASGTDYTVIITNTSVGCTDDLTIHVDVNDVTATVNPVMDTINPGQSVTLTAGGGFFYSWTPGSGLSCTNCQSTVASPEETTTYTVTVSDSIGCMDVVTATVVVEDVIVPNVFTPNGDGINDVLRVWYYGNENIEFFVFDRWGVLLWETTNRNAAWDGKGPNGNDVPEGVYFFVGKIGDDVYKQTVTLMR